MKPVLKNILSVIVLIGGEAIIVAAFFLLRGDAPDNVFALNLIVSSFVYILLFADLLVPWRRIGDKSDSRLGSIGIRWMATIVYAIVAVAFMLVANLVFDWSFQLQVIVHCCFVFFMLLAFVGLMASSSRISSVYEEQTTARKGLDDIRRAAMRLSDTVSLNPALPSGYREKASEIESEIRFISPSASAEAADMENELARLLHDLDIEISNYGHNGDTIDSLFARSARVLSRRKNLRQ